MKVRKQQISLTYGLQFFYSLRPTNDIFNQLIQTMFPLLTDLLSQPNKVKLKHTLRSNNDITSTESWTPQEASSLRAHSNSISPQTGGLSGDYTRNFILAQIE